MSNRIDRKDIINDEDIKKAIKEVNDEFKTLKKQLKAVISSGSQLNKVLGKSGSYKQIIKYTNQHAKSTNNLHTIEKQRIATSKKLRDVLSKNLHAEEKSNKIYLKGQSALKRKNAALKEELSLKEKSARTSAKLNKASSKEYFELIKKQEQLKKINQQYRQQAKEQLGVAKVTAAQKNMNGAFKEHVQSIGKTNDGLKKMSTYYKNLEKSTAEAAQQKAKEQAALEKQNKALANQRKRTNGLASSFKKLAKSVAGYFLAIASVQRIVQFFTRDLLNMNKKLDSQEYAMRTVIKNSIELKTTLNDLSEMAKNYGQDLIVLRERYTKFRAAAIQSNVTAQDTMKIFNSTAKAAGVLGLKSDELNGVFLALEQMLSKGKVTTEELRRQLGERLPGAMGIMADAIGVSISELDKMMKKGEILSSMALPKFADQIELAYGIESIETVNTLAAAQGRMSTAWIEFIESLESSDEYINIINNLASAIGRLRNSFEGLEGKASRFEGDILSDIMNKANDINDIEEKRAFLLKSINELKRDGKELEEEEAEILKKYGDDLEKIASDFGKNHPIFVLLDALGIFEARGLKASKALNSVQGEIQGINGAIDELSTKMSSLEDTKTPIDTWQDEYNKLESGLKNAPDIYEEIESIGLENMNDYTYEMAQEYLKDGKNYEEYLDNKIKEIDKYVGEAERQWAKEEALYDPDAYEERIKMHKNFVDETKKKIRELEELKDTQSGKDKKITEAQIENTEELLSSQLSALRKAQAEYKRDRERVDESYKARVRLSELQKEMQMEMESLTEDDSGGGSTGDDRLQKARIENQRKIAESQKEQRLEWQKFVEKTNDNEIYSELEKRDKIAEFESKQNVDLLELKKELNEGLTGLTEDDSVERLQILKDAAEIEKQIQDEKSTENIKNVKRDNEIEIDYAEQRSKDVIEKYYDESDAAMLAQQETTKAIIENRKLRNREIEKLQRELAEAEVRNDIIAVKKMIASGDLYGDAITQKWNELEALQKRLNELEIQHSKEGNKNQLENLKEWAQGVSEIYNTLMDVLINYYDKQLEMSRNLYEKQVSYAGASVEQRMEAETQLEKREAEIKKKKARAEKAQTIFNIGMKMFEASVELPSPIAIAQLIAGGIAIAGAIAEPIPEYKKGGKHKGGTAKVSEKGSELFIDKKGKAYLTPEKETIANFPAGEFIPHDQTQQMLAEYAMNQQSELLDMSSTNNHLKNIERNTHRNGSVEYMNNYKIVKRYGVTSKIRVR